MTCRLCILGAGPAGLAAAFEAAKLGIETTLVERAELGGTCLNRGCIPTKLLLGATKAVPELKAQARLKLLKTPAEPVFDLNALQQRKARVVAGSRQAVAKQLELAGVTLVTGQARCAGPGKVLVQSAKGETSIEYDSLIVATGSRPSAPPGLAPDGALVLDSDQLLELTAAPARLLVVGGGAIGLELAEFYSRLGTKITLVELMDRLAPAEDPEIADALAKALKREGWEFRLGRKIEELERGDNEIRAVLDDGSELVADKILVATGRLPNSQALDLETLGVKMRGPGWIITDAQLEAAPNVYAVGDVNGYWLLAHAASHQARHAVLRIAGEIEAAYAGGPMPSCVFGAYELMRAGASVATLLKEEPGATITVSRAQLIANPMAQAAGATQGLVKAIWLDGRLAGLTAMGHGVSHLALQASLLVERRARVSDIELLVFPHPSLDEALLAALLAPRSAI
jgi:dihydrolipoamide dehydrogenase